MRTSVLVIFTTSILAYVTPATGQNFDGFNVALEANHVSSEFTVNGDTPPIAIEDAMLSIRLGYDHQFAGGLVLGASWTQSLSELETGGPWGKDPFLTHGATIEGLSGWDARVGYVVADDWLPFIAYGQRNRSGVIWQDCGPAPTGGRCAPFGPKIEPVVTGRRQASYDEWAPIWTAGIEYAPAAWWFLRLSYSESEGGIGFVSFDGPFGDVGWTEETDRVITFSAGARF